MQNNKKKINVFRKKGIGMRSYSITVAILIFVFISFSVQSALSQEPRDILPKNDEITVWKLSDDIKHFKAEDMWKQINGAQDQYLKYDCHGLTVAYYKDKSEKNELSIEIYLMPDELCAFGIISEQKPSESLKKSLGGQT